MTLDKDSRLVRFAYFFRDREYRGCDKWNNVIYSKAPVSTTLCRFFWRAFVFMPLLCALAVTGVTAVLTTLIMLVVDKPLVALLTLVVVGAVFGVCATIDYIQKNGINSATWNNVKESTFVQGAKAIKGKFCPLIEIK